MPGPKDAAHDWDRGQIQPNTPAFPNSPSLSPSAAKRALESARARGKTLLDAPSLESAAFETWCNVTRDVKSFGSDSDHITTFNRAGRNLVRVVTAYSPPTDYDQLRRNELAGKMAVLAAILDAVLFDEPAAAEATSEGAEAQAVVSGTDVFVVHGHDEATKARVARLLERLGLRPVVLHEQPNRGMTIIEKFEKHAGAAGFAVILLTADDVGCGESEGKTRPRARQNVVLELGYFIGKLGRSRVAVLHAPSVELPSDILGVAYTSLSSSWEFALAKELRAAGYAIDLNKLA